jgi:transcriptional regulator with XRE-family HTH domain
MFAARSIRRCRESSGLTLRALAERAGTSHSALAAYEAGRKVPNLATWERILLAAGWEPEVRCRATPDATAAERRGEELEEVLALAGHFPARHDKLLRAPIFGRR